MRNRTDVGLAVAYVILFLALMVHGIKMHHEAEERRARFEAAER